MCDGQFGMYSVQRIGKGRIPDQLTGLFQTRKAIIDLIDKLDLKD